MGKVFTLPHHLIQKREEEKKRGGNQLLLFLQFNLPHGKEKLERMGNELCPPTCNGT